MNPPKISQLLWLGGTWLGGSWRQLAWLCFLAAPGLAALGGASRRLTAPGGSFS